MQQDKPPVTQRAYTLRLRGADLNDQSWRDALWQTHEAVNQGAKVFGDWLLTLRGGLDHRLASEPELTEEYIEQEWKSLKKKAKNRKVELSKADVKKSVEQKRRDRIRSKRILLALSWLSVESERGSPQDHKCPKDEQLIVAYGDKCKREQDNQDSRNRKLITALCDILKKRGVPDSEIGAPEIEPEAQPETWIGQCAPSLEANIRDDAVWVNRSKAFDKECNGHNIQEGREDARTLLWYLLTDDYLKLPAKEETKEEKKQSESSGQGEEESGSEKNADAASKSGKGAGQRTRHPFSHIFGREGGKGFGNPLRHLMLRDHWQETLKSLMVTTAGMPLSDPNTPVRKGEPPSPTEFHREMFSKAAARLAQIWTKQKQQELEREQRKIAVEELEKLERDDAYREALNLLDEFCQERGESTGAHEQYRINLRAIKGWDLVVAAWNGITETDPNVAEELRINATKRLKAENPDDKLGDINLFISLAETEYEPVWRHKGQANPAILKTYVKGWKARTDAARLKVAAFRHPDPCFHPIFCQFGVSRPSIKFSRLDGSCKDDARIVKMRLWYDSKAVDTKLLAVSKRFDQEIGSIGIPVNDTSTSVLEVTRRSRLGIAAVDGANEDTVYRVTHVFDEQKIKPRKGADDGNVDQEAGDDESQSGKKNQPRKLQKKPSWNGTLQADRLALEAIGKMDSAVEKKKAKQRLRWWLIVSLELQQKGPWYAFIENSPDKTAFTHAYRSGDKTGVKFVDFNRWPHADENKDRKGQARLILSRIPDLRVLSVDLGHRYAAACAVWKVIKAKDVRKACRDAGHKAPKAEDIYLHLKKKVTKQKKGKQVEVEETKIYRRIGADTLPDGNSHPAPWARLDRQFLIKLQGEKEGVRQASNEEIWAVHQMEAALGRPVPLIDRLIAVGWGGSEKQNARLEGLKRLGWNPAVESVSGDESDMDEGEFRSKPPLSVDELMFSAVNTMRLVLERHGDRARIAFAMTAGYKPMPGDRRYYFNESKELSANDDQAARDNKHIEFILDALVLWHSLALPRKWRDDTARQLWDDHVVKLPGYKILEESGEKSPDRERKSKRKKDREAVLRGKLYDTAKALAQDVALRQTLHDAWKKRWEDDDEQLQKQIRWVKDWILPRGKAANDPAIRKVGGLSLTRLATLTEFRRKVQVGFFTRLKPDGTRTETKERFGQSTLGSLERLREQRVKQLASRIAEAALGIGQVMQTTEGKTTKRPDVRVNEPCHAIVIENLTNYRPEETRTRRENRQLMSWASSKVKKYLSEACQLHGLHLREVSAEYTSRQDSRTGAPGIRCQDVSIKEFMQSPLWRKKVVRLGEKQSKSKRKDNACDQFLCDLNAIWKDKTVTDWAKAGVVRVPLDGGEVFVSADSTSSAAKGLQADLNAAANIGLRALTDPDWYGKWWYVPCDSISFKPVKDKVSGSAVVPDKALCSKAVQPQSDDAKTKAKKVINLWRDISSSPLKSGEWKEYSAYWNDVQRRVVRILEKQIKDCDKCPQ